MRTTSCKREDCPRDVTAAHRPYCGALCKLIADRTNTTIPPRRPHEPPPIGPFDWLDIRAREVS